jgi:hypothetical protein
MTKRKGQTGDSKIIQRNSFATIPLSLSLSLSRI